VNFVKFGLGACTADPARYLSSMMEVSINPGNRDAAVNRTGGARAVR